MSRASNARGMAMFQQGIMQWAMQKQAQAQALEIQKAKVTAALEKRSQDIADRNNDRQFQLSLAQLNNTIQQTEKGAKGSTHFPSVGKSYKSVPDGGVDKEITPAYVTDSDGKQRYVGFWAGNSFKAGEMPQEQDFSMIEAIEKTNPSEAYARGYRMTDDAKLYRDDQTGNPVKLPPFTDVMGKRGQVKEVKLAGELYDDAKELNALLIDPEVANNLGKIHKAAQNQGLFSGDFIDRATGKISNEVRSWMQRAGIHPNTKTGEAFIRIGKLASDQRKTFMGTAVTDTELKSSLNWMPRPEDDYQTMIGKVNVLETESEQSFRRWIGLYKDIANMTPFYKAFGIERFGTTETAEKRPTPTTKPKYQRYHVKPYDIGIPE